MKEIKLHSFAKINLSIDVGRVMESGMHPVDMVMQQLSFHDDVNISYEEIPGKDNGDMEIVITTNRYYIPTDDRNLAYKAVELMTAEFGDRVFGGRIEIDILKRIPVAGGLAGGSGNGAAVLHGLNVLWGLRLSLKQLCALGSRLGSDVPFCVMGQASYNFALPKKVRKDPLAVSCARATGTGTTLKPLKGIRKSIVIAKPSIGVSTKEVYAGIDKCSIEYRPDNDLMEKGIRTGNREMIYRNFINVLENYTLNQYPQVKELKELMEQNPMAEKVLMSGSGPTVFAVFASLSNAREACSELRKNGYEAYWTKTTK